MRKTAPDQLADGNVSNLVKRLKLSYCNVEFGDAVLLLYVMAFVRQYLWLASSNDLAWVLTALVSLIVWHSHLLTKRSRSDEERIPGFFWPVVTLPLLVVYAMRAAFPDGSFDQLNYHLLSSVRALEGLPFTNADFFPAPLQLNPAPEMITGMARYVLGYRLGTIINWVAMVWSGTILYKLLAGYVGNRLLRCVGVLFTVFTEQALFEINNYMVDLLAVPLLLEATYLILNTGKDDERYDHVRIALFLGASVAFKLTNLGLVLPLILLYAYKLFAGRALTPRSVWLLVISFLAPLLPFSVFMYWQTQSPLFPFYNKIFRSPYWPLINWVDVRWGPKTLWETLAWPIVISFRPQRTSELAVYSGRLSLIFAVAILCLALKVTGKNTRTLSVIILLGLAFWTITTGYVRYAVYLEMLGGVLVLHLSYHVASKATLLSTALRQVVAALPWALLLLHSFLGWTYVYKYEWGMRPTIFHNREAFFAEARYLLRDHSFLKFVPSRERQFFNNVDVWIESSFITSGLETVSRPDAPIILVCFPYYFETKESLDRFDKTLSTASNRKMYTLVFTKDLSPSLDMLYFRGLEMGRFIPVSLPFYSEHTRFDMVLIEILPAGKGLSREHIKTTRAASPLPDRGFRAELHVADLTPMIKAGTQLTVHVSVKNVSDSVWPALGQSDGKYSIRLANHWLNAKEEMLVQDDARASLIYDLRPGHEIELPLTVGAPAEPGQYVLEIDMVQELVAWFGSRSSNTLKLKMTVEP